MEFCNVEQNRVIIKFAFSLLFIFLLSCAETPNLSEQEGNAIAVWNVERLLPMPGQPDLGELFSDQIIQTLNKSGNCRVIERKSLHLALQELKLNSLADESTHLRLGKILGARWMVFGGYFATGAQMRVDLRIVEVETGKVKKAVQKTTTSQDLNDWLTQVREAAAELL
jgi:curli biogenesis system outer membrane secretion channel CsgG